MTAPTSPTHRAVTVTVRVGLRTVLGIDLSLDGESRLPDPGYVLAHNLVSPLDAFVLALALGEAGHPEPTVMLRGSIRSVPFLGPLLAAGALVLGESKDDDAFTTAARAIADGRTVVTSPEPVVSRSLEVGSLRSDPVRLATATSAPLVAAATFGAHRLFDEKGRLRLRRGVPVKVTFGNEVPVTGSLNFAPTLRMLRLDLEALLGQTLDGYPKADYAEGQWWWPASRHGGAPSVLEAMADPQPVSSPNAELWADDARVVAARAASGGLPPAPEAEHDDIDGPLFLQAGPVTLKAIDPDEEAPKSEAQQREERRRAAEEAAERLAERQDPTRSRDVPIRAQTPVDLHRQNPDVWAAPPELDRDLAVDEEPAGASASWRDRVQQTVHGVTGLLAFDMPGHPRQLFRKASLSATDHDLWIEVDEQVICLREVEIDRNGDHSFFWGRLGHDHSASSGDMRLTVPAGTRSSFVAARRSG